MKKREKTHLETDVMTCESCALPMTEIFAFGHIQRKRGEYYVKESSVPHSLLPARKHDPQDTEGVKTPKTNEANEVAKSRKTPKRKLNE